MESKLDEQIILDKYNDVWNGSLDKLQSDYDKDKEEFVNDNAIGFKWTHLIQQEIWMWISLCCGDVVDYDQVPLEDFKFIVNRRGFTPRITNNLRNILVEIGIGKKLKEK